MPKAEHLRLALNVAVADTTIAEMLPQYLSDAPEWLDPDEDKWNVAPLHPRSDIKTFTLDFTRVINAELKAIARAHALWQVVEKQVGPTSLLGALNAFIHLGRQIGSRPVRTIKTEDLYETERDIAARYAPGTSARACVDLQSIAAWLNRQVGFRLDYTNTRRAPAQHGRMSSDSGRDAKLLPDTVVADLLSARHRPNVSNRDRFYLATIAISAATGFRLAELLTLPEDCLIHDAGVLLVRSFVSKHGKAAPRPVPPELADIVVDAVDYIRHVTRPARELALNWTKEAPIDWTSVFRDAETTACEYFVRRWLADWIKNPDHRMIDARYAYFSRGNRSRWVPLAAFLEANSNNASAAAREFCLSRSSVTTMIQQLEASRCGVVYLGTKSADSRRAFDTDRRFPSISAFGRLTGVNFTNSPRSNLLRDLIDEAREAQLSQSEYGRPNDDLYLESKYRAAQNILSDPASGKTVLNLAEALFVTFKNQMSVCHKVDPERVQAVSFGQFNNWLAGYARDRGTDRPGEAVCARLDIFDPRTEEPAKLTNHDFRHWLETAYENGGLSQTQIATLFNRSSTKANAGYDQTNSKLRRERLKDALTDGFLLGHAAEAYVQIAKNSPEEAADYLEAATKFYNPMPHGICRLNWAMEPCPHALSCFSCGDAQDDASEPCEHLIIDIANRAQIEEIARIHRNAQSIAQIMYEDGANGSPQFAQFQRIARSTRFILDKVGRP